MSTAFNLFAEDPVLVHTWEQNDTGLTIKLSTGPVVTSDDVNAEFTGRDFHLRLAGWLDLLPLLFTLF